MSTASLATLCPPPLAAGSGLTNALLMRYGSSLLELLPYNFTECCSPLKRFYPTLMRINRDAVQYWSIR